MIDVNLTGKTALVFGASQGIGKACAIQLAKQNATIHACARNKVELLKLVNSLPKTQQSPHAYSVLDLLDSATLAEQLDIILAKHHTIDIVINNAGGPQPGPITAATADDFANAFTMHVQANVLIAQKLLPRMKEQRHGRIINIISSSVKSPIENLGVSNTTRWAVAALAKTLSYEVAEFGVTVNSVLPGFIMTPRLRQLIASRAKDAAVSDAEMEIMMCKTVPTARLGDPEEVANVVGFLASPAASYVNGVALTVDGGKTRCL